MIETYNNNSLSESRIWEQVPADSSNKMPVNSSNKMPEFNKYSGRPRDPYPSKSPTLHSKPIEPSKPGLINLLRNDLINNNLLKNM